MPSLQEAMQKVAQQQGIQVAPATTPAAESFGRKPIRQTRTIKFDKDSRYNRKATAPYNFVPLNEKIIAGERYNGFDAFGKDERKTGYILCDIECLTPIYIRDAISEEENKRELKSRAIPSFFSPAGQIRIPGSSLRGMTRTLVEILSWSKITTDRKCFFYYRGLADKSNLRDEYQPLMASFDRRTKKPLYKMSAGYLQKVGTQYQITPAQVINDRQFYQVDKKATKGKFPMASEFESYYYKSGNNYIVISGFMPNKKHDWVLHPPKERPSKTEVLEILDVDIRNYNLDENRNEPQPGCNILKIADKKKGELIPCFYVEWREGQNRRVSFGHTAFFRLAYKQNVGDLLPSGFNVFDSEHPDIAEAIFGMVPESVSGADERQKPVAGRVFFEDAQLVSQSAPSMQTGLSQILSSPKPTTFQHYLVQTSDFIKELLHYNSETVIRGHKQFWNQVKEWQTREVALKRDEFARFIGERQLKIPDEFKEEKMDKIIIHNFPDLKDANLRQAIIEFIQSDEKSQYSVITPIRAASRFIAKIRFENLTDIELGAVLFALDLPANCCHKIGMGKPIGLGSVKITPKLFLSDRVRRYSALFSEWLEEQNPESEKSFGRFKQAFEQHIVGELEPSEISDTRRLWDTYRLKQLQTMLDWSHANAQNWNNLTRYLEIEHPQNENEYKNRPILPLPEDVVKFKR